jgi:anti-sigma B factor antagonist
MNISDRKVNNYTVVSLEGTLNSTSAPDFQKSVEKLVNESHLVIDFEKVDFLDSSGLGAVVGLARRIKSNNAVLRLAHMNEKVRKVFEVTLAFMLFDIYDDVLAAAESE